MPFSIESITSAQTDLYGPPEITHTFEMDTTTPTRDSEQRTFSQS